MRMDTSSHALPSFSAVRRQTAPEDGGKELQVLDYQVCQSDDHFCLPIHRLGAFPQLQFLSYFHDQVIRVQNQQRQLLPLVAMAYAFHFTGAYMTAMYKKSVDQIGVLSVHFADRSLLARCW